MSGDKQSGNPIRVLAISGSNFGRGGLSTMVYNWAMMMPPERVIFDFFSVKPYRNSGFLDAIKTRGGRLFTAGIPESESANSAKVYLSLSRVLKERKYSIVHIHCDAAYKGLLYAVCAKAHRCETIVIHSHSSGVERKAVAKRVLNAFARQCLPAFATDFFSCSDAATFWMYPKRLANKAVLIGNDIDVDRFAFDASKRNAIRNDLGVGNASFVVGFVGRLEYAKDPLKVIDIFRALHDRDSSSKLLMLGDGTLRGRVEASIDQHCLKDSVICFDCTETPEILYQAMDVLCMPSRYEGNPLVIGEAQASGLQCVVSDVVPRDCDMLGSMRFLPRDNEESWVQALLDIKNDPVDRNDLYMLYRKKHLQKRKSRDVLLRFYSERAV